MGQTCQPLGGPRYFGHHAFLAATFRAIKIQIYSRTPLALKCREIVHSVARMASAPRLGRQFLGVSPTSQLEETVRCVILTPGALTNGASCIRHTPIASVSHAREGIGISRVGANHELLKGAMQRATGGATCTHGWPGRGVCSLSERPGFLYLLTYLGLGQPSSPISILDFSFIPREDICTYQSPTRSHDSMLTIKVEDGAPSHEHPYNLLFIKWDN